jgi:aminopeptidase N
MILKQFFTTLLLLYCIFFLQAQTLNKTVSFSRADTLRGTDGAYRQGWDVMQYDITVKPNIAAKTIEGKCQMLFYDMGTKLMQIDLQEPMILDSVKNTSGTKFTFTREKNVYWLMYRDTASNLAYKIRPSNQTLIFYFHGKPKEAVRAPWDGGWVWKKDTNNNPWVTVACQGLGASVWYPCKDIQSDKPDSGAILQIIVPDSLVGVGNGNLVKKEVVGNNLTKYIWQVKKPINNYCIVPYIGKYVNFNETYNGLKGKLNFNYWVMDYSLQKAKQQFTDAPKMMKAFEHWFGPYPFYEDGYQLVEAPHLGMEHQSGIAYGNKFKMGYSGMDLSGTGIGLKWDFIIVHESGHEWFANNICTKDIADMWVHEGFTCYSETLFTEYYFGKEAANKYVQGIRGNIQNDINIIGSYGVNKEGSGDMYYKAANMLHTIRQITNNDTLFRAMLIELNKRFGLQTVTTQEVENFISTFLKIDCSSIFNQYLRSTKIPTLEYKFVKNKFCYRWINAVDNLKLPIKIMLGSRQATISPNNKWQDLKVKKSDQIFNVDANYFVEVKKV